MIPTSTYRVQLYRDFGFADLKKILPYLHKLGVDAIYASPVFEAVSGSTHGYDVVEPHKINPEIGTLEQLREIRKLLDQYHMHWIQDIVPNHMALHPTNSRLMDVLERGPQSEFYNYFDINWEHPDRHLHKKMLLPVLGKTLQSCIEDSEIQLTLQSTGIFVSYFDQHFPLSLKALPELELPFLDRLSQNANASLTKWKSFATGFYTSLSSDEKTQLKIRLREINVNPQTLTRILQSLYYLPEYWRTTETSINYRRFFTVNSLICLNMQDKNVFEEYHSFILELCKEGLFDGLRIDHIDGLQNPDEYLDRLRKKVGLDAYIVAEKILEADEELPAEWPIQGETGYHFLALTNKLLTDKSGSEKLRDFYFTRCEQACKDYRDLARKSKVKILTQFMHGEWNNLARLVKTTADHPDLVTDRLKEAVGCLLVCFPVYRIYPQQLPLSGRSLHYFKSAREAACKHWPALSREIQFVYDFLSDPPAEARAKALHCLRRLMQFTGPLTAKGVEDTTFYRYNALLSHNEVGDSPEKLSMDNQTFHERMNLRLKNAPQGINGTSSHDTKRGEDARMRLNALSYFPEEWMQFATKWWQFDPSNACTENDRYMILQSIVAGYSDSLDEVWLERFKAFLQKALREAKENSSWEAPNTGYEAACEQYAQKLLEDQAFQGHLETLIEKTADRARNLSLFQLVLKATAPGIPDIYQGCEISNYSFVDPDNRRPVDYGLLKQLMEEGELKELSPLDNNKFQLTRLLLNLRKEYPKLFAQGDYNPLSGDFFGFTRRLDKQWLLVVLDLKFEKQTEFNLSPDAPTEWEDVLENRKRYSREELAAGLFDQKPYRVFISNAGE